MHAYAACGTCDTANLAKVLAAIALLWWSLCRCYTLLHLGSHNNATVTGRHAGCHFSCGLCWLRNSTSQDPCISHFGISADDPYALQLTLKLGIALDLCTLLVLSWATVGTLLVPVPTCIEMGLGMAGQSALRSEAIGYTAGPAPLKYIGLGDLTVASTQHSSFLFECRS